MASESGFGNDLLEIESKEKSNIEEGNIELDDDMKLDILCFCKNHKIDKILRSSDNHYSIILRDAAVHVVKTHRPDELHEEYIYEALKELLIQRDREDKIPHIIASLKKIKNNSINDKKDEKSDIKNKTIQNFLSLFM